MKDFFVVYEGTPPKNEVPRMKLVIVVSNRTETRRRAEDSTDSTARRANTVSVLVETTIRKNLPPFAKASAHLAGRHLYLSA